MLNRIKVEKSAKGFSVKPTPEYIEKQQREQRIKKRKENPSKSPTNVELFEFLQDTNDRLSEIYDLLKK